MRIAVLLFLISALASVAAAQAPVVQDIVPPIGSGAGGAAITIAGIDFTGATDVKFGATSATNVVVVNSALITCTLPPGTGNTRVDVSVTAGAQTGTLTDGFTYLTKRLAVGDIWVIGYRGDDPDGFVFVPWVPLLPDEMVALTDKSFDGATGEFTQSEDMLLWQAPATGLTAGTVVVISCPAAATPIVNVGAILWGTTDGISNDGDQMFVVQGDLAPSGLIFGVTFAPANPGSGWITTGPASNNDSYLPPTLNAPGGNLDIALGGNEDNADYFGARTGLDASGYKALIEVVTSTTDWRRDNSGGSFGPLDATPFVLPLGPNQPPVNTLPGAQSINEDATLVFAGGASISIADPDAGANPIEASLDVTSGTLAFATTTGLTFTSGANNSATMTVTGTLAAINAALNGMSFTPDSDFSGTVTLTIATDDLGSTGTGGALTDTDTLIVTVAAVNDAPVVSAPAALSVDPGATIVFSGGKAVSVADVDAGTISVTVTATAGTLSATASGSATLNVNASPSLQITGNIADVNATLDGMIFTAPSTTQVVTLTVNADDQGNTGSGGPKTDTASVPINVGSVKLPISNGNSSGSSGCAGAPAAGMAIWWLAVLGVRVGGRRRC